MKMTVTMHDGEKLVIDADLDGYRKLQKICERSLFLAKELKERTEQLAISQEHVAKLQDQLRTATAQKTSTEKFASMSVENQLSAIDEAINGNTARYEALFSTSDHQLAADIKALTERVAKVESCMFTPESFEKAVGYVVKDEIDKACRIGGILSRRS